MPIILPPMIVDVPAVIQPAAHIASVQSTIPGHPVSPLIERPAAGSEQPLSLGKPPVARLAASSEQPFIVRPRPVTAPSGTNGPSTGTMPHRNGR